MKRLLHSLFIAGVVVAGLATAPPARADWRSLSGTLPSFASLVYATISPDSKYAAYVADADVDEQYELYIVPLAGGTPLKLNPPLPPGSDVYVELQGDFGQPTDVVGPDQSGLNAVIVANTQQATFRVLFTLDSRHVLYIADQEENNRAELYRVPVQGGTAEKLNGTLVGGGDVSSFLQHPDGTSLVYRADQETDGTYELWSIVGDNEPLKSSGALTTGGNVDEYQIDPFNNRIVYSADGDTDGMYELYSVPIAVGAPLKLGCPRGPGVTQQATTVFLWTSKPAQWVYITCIRHLA